MKNENMNSVNKIYNGDTLYSNISKIESVAFTYSKNLLPDREKSTPLSLIASPTIIRKFRRRNDDQFDEEKRSENNNSTPTGKTNLTKKRSFLRGSFFNDEERSRSKTWGPDSDSNAGQSNVVQHDTETRYYDKVKLKLQTTEQKQKTQKKLRELVAKVLKKNLEYCTYNAKLSRKRCTHISQILETIFRSTLNHADTEYKILALVYIGEIRENGMRQSFQYNLNADTDFFILETYRNDDMFATGVVFATLVENHDEICYVRD